MPDDRVVEERLRAFVERVVASARLPAATRDEAREDYLELLRADVDPRIAAGISRDRAIADAIVAFGRPDVVSEALEAGVMMDGFARNLSNAVRALRRRPL